MHILFWNSEEYISEWNYPHILCCSITPAGYSWLIPVISDIHAQIAWLSRNNYKLCLWIHSQTIFTNMAMRVLVYFWVEIAFISLSFAHNSQIANTLWFLQNVNEVQPLWNDVFNFTRNFTHSNVIIDENVHFLFWK